MSTPDPATRHSVAPGAPGAPGAPVTPGAPVSPATPAPAPPRYASFAEFYPHYLAEHADQTSRRLHFVGTAGVLALAGTALASQRWWLLAALPVVGYGFAWAGHFFFEKNRPATFRHPLYSLAGDFRMFGDILAGRIRF